MNNRGGVRAFGDSSTNRATVSEVKRRCVGTTWDRMSTHIAINKSCGRRSGEHAKQMNAEERWILKRMNKYIVIFVFAFVLAFAYPLIRVIWPTAQAQTCEARVSATSLVSASNRQRGCMQHCGRFCSRYFYLFSKLLCMAYDCCCFYHCCLYCCYWNVLKFPGRHP